MRIYLAGKMRGLVGNNDARFNIKAAELRGRGFEVFNPVELNGPYPESGPDLEARQEEFMREAMAKDCAAVCRSAAIYLQEGWDNNSLGAFAEWAVARAIPIVILYEKDDYDGRYTPEYVAARAAGKIKMESHAAIGGIVMMPVPKGYC